jgi:hypothetical protein
MQGMVCARPEHVRQRKDPTMRTLLTLAVFTALLQGTISMTAAEDTQPCGGAYWHDGVELDVQDCELWTDSVPVYAGYEGEAATQVVGELVNATGNWFVCQIEGASAGVPGTEYSNTWWAETMADNGEWGFVNQAWFAGGDNNQPDAGLRNCSDAPGSEPPSDDDGILDWQDCIWGGAPADTVVHTFEDGVGGTFTLNCRNVNKIYAGHGFTYSTIDCIQNVFWYSQWTEPSNTDPRNDLRKLVSEIPGYPRTVFTAYVVTDRTNLHVVTAYVELYDRGAGYGEPWSGDTWDACASYHR